MSSCDPIPSFEAGQEQWNELAERSGSIFATWEWATSWWRHFGQGEPLLLRCGDPGDPLAIVPLCRAKRGPLRILRFIGYGPGDALGPVCAREDREAAGEALREALTVADRVGKQPLLRRGVDARRVAGGGEVGVDETDTVAGVERHPLRAAQRLHVADEQQAPR